MEQRRYPLFDWMRLFFALSVVFWHVNTASQVNLLVSRPIPLVPAFLAISGYLVLQSWERSRGAAHFWWKRALRVVPAMVVSLVLTTVLGGWHALADSMAAYLSLGLSMDYTGNAPLWSLSCEEILYFLLTVLAGIGAYKRHPWAIFVLLGLSLWLYQSTLDATQAQQRIAMLPASFFIGNVVYMYRSRLFETARKFGWLICLSALALRIGEQFLQGIDFKTMNEPGYWILYALALIGLLLACLSKGGDRPARMDLSYGCYVYHWPIMRYFVDSGVIGWQMFPICIGLTLLMAVLSWKFVEAPCLRLKSFRLKDRREAVEAAK